jgi:CRISPR-associated protein Cas8a1/Csx13
VRHWQAESETSLAESPARALALLYAPVGAIYFQVHRRAIGVRPQYCLVLPAVGDLRAYGEARQLFLRQGVARLQVAGSAEAAARVLAELEAHGLLRSTGTDRCEVVAFGTVPWSKQQKTRVERFTVTGARPEALDAYRVASAALPPRLATGKPDPRAGEAPRWWVVPQVPDLVARNALVGTPWWREFGALWARLRQAEKRPERREWVLRDERRGLQEMVGYERTMPDGPEARLVRACHDAWYRRLGALSQRARDHGLSFRDLRSREHERMRINLARCKSAAMLRQTLTDFWSRAGSPLPELQEAWPELLPLLGERWRDARDLALLSLASYKGRGTPEEDEPLGADGPTGADSEEEDPA